MRHITRSMLMKTPNLRRMMVTFCGHLMANIHRSWTATRCTNKTTSSTTVAIKMGIKVSRHAIRRLITIRTARSSNWSQMLHTKKQSHTKTISVRSKLMKVRMTLIRQMLLLTRSQCSLLIWLRRTRILTWRLRRQILRCHRISLLTTQSLSIKAEMLKSLMSPKRSNSKHSRLHAVTSIRSHRRNLRQSL